MSIKVWQTVVHISPETGDCLVQNRHGNSYPVQLNRFIKTIEPGDKVQVTKTLSGEWIIIDVDHHYPEHLDISDFPRDENNDLNWIAYHQYLDVIKDMRTPERVRFDKYLKEQWRGHQ